MAGAWGGLCRALTAWYSDREGWADLIARGMNQDWSWTEPALDYIELWVACTLPLFPSTQMSCGVLKPRACCWAAGQRAQETACRAAAANVHDSAVDRWGTTG